MAAQRQEITKRIKNRLLLSISLFIACGLGFLILLDSRHLGTEVRFTNQVQVRMADQGEELVAQGLPCISYSAYRFLSVKDGITPKITDYDRPVIAAYNQPDLSVKFTFTLDFSDGKYYDFRLVQVIPDVNKDGTADILASVARIDTSFNLSSGGENYHNLIPTELEYYAVLINGQTGALFGGLTLAAASFSSCPFTEFLWVDYDFTGPNAKITQRDSMPDVVGLYNITENDYYLEAYHLDVANSTTLPGPRLAWSLNNSVANIQGGGKEYMDIILLNSTIRDNVLIITKIYSRFMTVFACNGTFGVPEKIAIASCNAHYDFTHDGTEELLCITYSQNPFYINVSIFDATRNETLPMSQKWDAPSTGDVEANQWVFGYHANVSTLGGYPTFYISTNTYPTGTSWDSATLTPYLWRVQYQPNGINSIEILNLDYIGQVQILTFTQFNEDNVYDIGLFSKDQRGGGSDTYTLAVYDGATGNVLDSLPGQSSYSGVDSLIFISDIGGNQRPDVFFVGNGGIFIVSFETLFFWQQNVELTVMFFLCIAGFIWGFTILYQWRKSLRVVPTPEGVLNAEGQPIIPTESKSIGEPTAKARRSPIKKTLVGLIVALAAINVPFILILRIQSIGLPMQAADVRLVHLITLIFLIFYSMIPVVAVIFNIAAPIFATSLYLKAQASFIRAQPGKHDYRVLVLDFGDREKRSLASYLSRSIFPILLAVAVGINVFNRFNTAGSLTGFSGNQQMQNWIISFEFLCMLPIILTFVGSSMLIPSSWLLDDAGVVFYVENLVFREPGDISKISDWLLKYIKAFAGFTAILSYFTLFTSTSFVIEMENDLVMSAFMTIGVFAFIVVFPFIGGLIYMFVAQITVENNLSVLKQALFQRMNAMGIDTTPHKLRDVFDPKDRAPREFEKIWQSLKGKNKRGSEGKHERLDKEESPNSPQSNQ